MYCYDGIDFIYITMFAILNLAFYD